MKPAQKLVSLLFFVIFLAFATKPAEAAQILNAKLTLSDSRPAISATHTFIFTHQTSATLKQISFKYCTQPSALNDACGTINGLDTTTGTKGTVTGLTNGSWTLDASSVAGNPLLNNTGAGESINANTVITVPMESILNHAIDDCQAGGDTSSDTCYVRIRSYTGLGTGLIDQGIVSYTVVAAVTVSARVDPSFTFIVESVDSATVHSDITTSTASTFSTLPFSNLTAGTPKYVAHSLRVTTNTQSGYTISMKMLESSGAILRGNYTSNNIDPFIANWSTPTTWTEPTGTTPNDNTGWIGANTTDTDVSGWGTPSQKFGTVSSTAYTVMQSNSSDNGATPVYVTYAIEANVFQPADTYSGTLQYNALPVY